MTDIVGPMGSSYNLASMSASDAGTIPTMSMERTLPRQVSTGQSRGTQAIGYKGAKIDSSNNQIVLSAPDGSNIGIGSIPGFPAEVGLFSTNPQGQLIMKIVNGTMSVYDPATTLNSLQVGLLPDDSAGIAGANDGYNVDDGF